MPSHGCPKAPGPLSPVLQCTELEQSRAASNSSSAGLGALCCFQFLKPASRCALSAHSHAPARGILTDCLVVCLFVFYFIIKGKKRLQSRKDRFGGTFGSEIRARAGNQQDSLPAASLRCSPCTEPRTTPSYTIPPLTPMTFIFVHEKENAQRIGSVIFLNATSKSKNLRA